MSSCASADRRLPYTVSCFRRGRRARLPGSSLMSLSATLSSTSSCKAGRPPASLNCHVVGAAAPGLRACMCRTPLTSYELEHGAAGVMAALSMFYLSTLNIKLRPCSWPDDMLADQGPAP